MTGTVNQSHHVIDICPAQALGISKHILSLTEQLPTSAHSSTQFTPAPNVATIPKLFFNNHDNHPLPASTSSENNSHVERRRGFNSEDFAPDSLAAQSFPSQISEQHPESLANRQSNPHNSHPPLPQINDAMRSISPRKTIYDIIDSRPVTFIIFVVMAIDVFLFLVFFLSQIQNHHFYALDLGYYIFDWIVTIIFLSEVNIRMYSYGIPFYFRSILRSLDYLLSCGNAALTIAFFLTLKPWLLTSRYLRILRIITAVTSWFERRLKGRTRLELQSLAELLESEKSDRTKLTKWEIEPEAIAIGERAGGGGFGTVFSGLFRGTLVAVKKVSYPDGAGGVNNIEAEATTLVNLRHPNVVLFMGFVHEDNRLWIVTEYCSRGSLRDVLDDEKLKLDEVRILKVALGAARGLAYLHGQDPPVLHLDLKSSNVLISSGWDAKLGDFGLSRSIDKIEKEWFSGTMQYAAPEILESNAFSTAADIYSFGVCLWEMAAREVPFQGLSRMAVLWGVVKSRLRPSLENIKISTPHSAKVNIETTKDPKTNPSNLNINKAVRPLIAKRTILEAGARHLDRGGNFSLIPNLYEDRDSRPGTNSTSIGEREERKTTDSGNYREKQDNVNFMSPCLETAHANIVEGILVPSSPVARDRASSPRGINSLEGHLRRQGASFSQSGNSRSMDQMRHTRSERNTHMSGLTRKVTATIQMFDERPPLIRRKEEEGPREFVAQSRTETHSTSVSAAYSAGRKRTLGDKSSLRPERQGPVLKSTMRKQLNAVHRGNTARGADDDDPFLRRLASVSKHKEPTEVTSGEGQRQTAPALQENEEQNKDAAQRSSTSDLSHSSSSSAAVPVEYVDLIKKCWSHDPIDRPSAGEIVWRLVILIDGHIREK